MQFRPSAKQPVELSERQAKEGLKNGYRLKKGRSLPQAGWQLQGKECDDNSSAAETAEKTGRPAGTEAPTP